MVLGTAYHGKKLLAEHLFLPMGGFLFCQEFYEFYIGTWSYLGKGGLQKQHAVLEELKDESLLI